MAIAELSPSWYREAGSGMGATLNIAAAMEAHGGERVVAMDSQGEGDGAQCAAVADALAERMGLSILENRKGLSPGDTAGAVPNDVLDLVFIDGEHRHPAVTRDFEGVLPFTDEHTVVVWHDYWLPGIAECVRTATEQGFRCWWVPTSCEMVVGTRDPQRFATITSLFPRGVENRRRPFPLTPYILMGVEIAKFRLGRLLRRGARSPSGRRETGANGGI